MSARRALPAAAASVASELVTDALLHGQPPICLFLRCDGPIWLELNVGDGDHRPPTLVEAPPDALGGRGVVLVDA